MKVVKKWYKSMAPISMAGMKEFLVEKLACNIQHQKLLPHKTDGQLPVHTTGQPNEHD